MSDDVKARADARLESALENAAERDPRPLYRPILRILKDRDPEAFARLIRAFDAELLPAVAGGADPLGAWFGYGRRLAEAVGAGRTVVIGPSGRSHTLEGDAPPRGLVLHLPDDEALPALVLRYPEPSTRAQDATVELLVQGRSSASAYGRS